MDGIYQNEIQSGVKVLTVWKSVANEKMQKIVHLVTGVCCPPKLRSLENIRIRLNTPGHQFLWSTLGKWDIVSSQDAFWEIHPPRTEDRKSLPEGNLKARGRFISQCIPTRGSVQYNHSFSICSREVLIFSLATNPF